MQIRYFQFATLRNLFAPRKPRNPLLRIALGLLGLAILAVLVVAGLFVGAAMIPPVGWNVSSFSVISERTTASRVPSPGPSQ